MDLGWFALPDLAPRYAPRYAPVMLGRYRGFDEQELTTSEGGESDVARHPGRAKKAIQMAKISIDACSGTACFKVTVQAPTIQQALSRGLRRLSGTACEAFA